MSDEVIFMLGGVSLDSNLRLGVLCPWAEPTVATAPPPRKFDDKYFCIIRSSRNFYHKNIEFGSGFAESGLIQSTPSAANRAILLRAILT